MTEVRDRDAAVQVAREYAEETCIGQLGEILDAYEEDGVWVVEFRTHTFSDEYEHRIRLNRVGNVFSHEREP